MTERQSWVPEGLDLSKPSAARVYDYYLGGFHNFAVDREMAQQAIAMWPELPMIMRANRAFLRRAVTGLVGLGVRQFLDIGSGIPTVGSVHSVAGALASDCRTVYVDIDPVAVAHSRAILGDVPGTGVVMADMRRPDDVLTDPALLEVLDLSQPVAVLMIALLHFVGDDADPATTIRAYRDALAPGSYLAVSHAAHDLLPEEQATSHQALYRRTASPMTMRGRDQVRSFFGGFDLVEPGLVELDTWRPDPDEPAPAHPCPAWAAVGRVSS